MGQVDLVITGLKHKKWNTDGPIAWEKAKAKQIYTKNESLKNIWISIKDTDTTRAKDQKMNESMATVESKDMIDAYKNFATTELSKLTRSKENAHNQEVKSYMSELNGCKACPPHQERVHQRNGPSSSSAIPKKTHAGFCGGWGPLDPSDRNAH